MMIKYVDKNKNLRKLQLKELEILKYFDEICKKNNVEYYLAYGTLLGAIRHKGFIPWDDDVDVLVTGEDFLRLYEVFAQENNPKYFFQSLKTEKNYYLFWNKIRLNNTIFVEKGWEDNEINNGIFIDIFPLIDYPKNSKDYNKMKKKIKVLQLLLDANIRNKNKIKYYGKSGKIIFKIVNKIPKCIRNRILIKEFTKICKYKSDSEYYFCIDTGIDSKLLKSSFKKTTLVDFEDTKFPAPYKYDVLLTEMFGDYMKLPNEEDRVGHGEVLLSFGDDRK